MKNILNRIDYMDVGMAFLFGAILTVVIFSAHSLYAYYGQNEAKNVAYMENDLFSRENINVLRFQDTVKTNTGTTTLTCYITKIVSAQGAPSISCVR